MQAKLFFVPIPSSPLVNWHWGCLRAEMQWVGEGWKRKASCRFPSIDKGVGGRQWVMFLAGVLFPQKCRHRAGLQCEHSWSLGNVRRFNCHCYTLQVCWCASSTVFLHPMCICSLLKMQSSLCSPPACSTLGCLALVLAHSCIRHVQFWITLYKPLSCYYITYLTVTLFFSYIVICLWCILWDCILC